MAQLETSASDAADYLNGADDVVAYIDAYLEDGSPEEIRAAIETVARSGGISEVAERTALSRAGFPKRLPQPQLRPSKVYGASCTRLVCD